MTAFPCQSLPQAIGGVNCPWQPAVSTCTSCLKLLNTPDLPRHVSHLWRLPLSILPLKWILHVWGGKIHRSRCRWRRNIATCHSGLPLQLFPASSLNPGECLHVWLSCRVSQGNPAGRMCALLPFPLSSWAPWPCRQHCLRGWDFIFWKVIALISIHRVISGLLNLTSSNITQVSLINTSQ